MPHPEKRDYVSEDEWIRLTNQNIALEAMVASLKTEVTKLQLADKVIRQQVGLVHTNPEDDMGCGCMMLSTTQGVDKLILDHRQKVENLSDVISNQRGIIKDETVKVRNLESQCDALSKQLTKLRLVRIEEISENNKRIARIEQERDDAIYSRDNQGHVADQLKRDLSRAEAEISALKAQLANQVLAVEETTTKMFPLQIDRNPEPGPLKIPWTIAEKAYSAYASKYGGSQSLETIAHRGGFSWSEMDSLYPKWRQEIENPWRVNSLQWAIENARRTKKNCSIWQQVASGYLVQRVFDFHDDARQFSVLDVMGTNWSYEVK